MAARGQQSSMELRKMIEEQRAAARAARRRGGAESAGGGNVPVSIAVAARRKPSKPSVVRRAEEYITIVCAAEERLVVPKHIARRCGCMATLLDSTTTFVESVTNTIHFPDIAAATMERVVAFLFRDHFTNGPDASVLAGNVAAFAASRARPDADGPLVRGAIAYRPPRPPTRTVFHFACAPENVMDLLATAHYLFLPPLVDICVRILADYIDSVPSLVGVPADVVDDVLALLPPSHLLKVEQADFLGLGPNAVDTSAAWHAACAARGYDLFFGAADRGMNRLLATPLPPSAPRPGLRPRTTRTAIDYRALYIVNYLAYKMAPLQVTPTVDAAAAFLDTVLHMAPELSCLDVPPHMLARPLRAATLDSFLPACSALRYLAINGAVLDGPTAAALVAFLDSHRTVTSLALRELTSASLDAFLAAYGPVLGGSAPAPLVLDELDLTSTLLSAGAVAVAAADIDVAATDAASTALFDVLGHVPTRLNCRATRLDLAAIVSLPDSATVRLTHLYADDIRAKFAIARGTTAGLPSLLTPPMWAQFATLPSLVELSLAHNEFTEWAVVDAAEPDVIAAVHFPPSLTALDLSRSDLRERHGPSLVAALAAACPALASLTLNRTGLDLDATPSVAADILGAFPQLVSLSLVGASVCEAAAIALVDALYASTAPVLERIDLSHNRIPLAWLAALIDAGGAHPTLASLAFVGNRSILPSELPSIVPGLHRASVYADLYAPLERDDGNAGHDDDDDGSDGEAGGAGPSSPSPAPFVFDPTDPNVVYDDDGFWEGPDGYFYCRDDNGATPSPSRPSQQEAAGGRSDGGPADGGNDDEYSDGEYDDDDDGGEGCTAAPLPEPPRLRLNVVHIVSTDEASELTAAAERHGIELQLK